MLRGGKNLLVYTNLFSPNDYEKNDKVMGNIFNSKKMNKLCRVICIKYRTFGKLQISYLLEKTLVLPIVCSKCKN